MKRILPFIVVLLFVVVASYLYTRNTSTQTNMPPKNDDITPLGMSPRYVDLSQPSVFTLATNPQLPTSLPVYSVSFADNGIESVQSLARSLSIHAQPTTIGAYHSWKNNSFSVSYNEPTEDVAITVLGVPSRDITTESSIESLYTSQVTNKEVVIKEHSIEKQPFVDGAEEVSLQRFEYQIQGMPLYFSITDSIALLIRKNSSGFITTVAANRTPTNITKKEDRSVLTKDQIIPLLEQKKGVLAVVSPYANTGLYSEPTSFSRVTLSSVTLAYLLSEKKDEAFPILVLSGVGSGEKETQKITYYLRATH